MTKCTGICSTCGKCRHAEQMDEANNRKTKLFMYPEDFSPDNGEGYGVAVDIGTTTVVGMLWDLAEGKNLGSCARTNPQGRLGSDVISRITYCIRSSEGLMDLNTEIRDCINGIIEDLCGQADLLVWDISRVVICGNTTMSHLFLNYKPDSLAVAPFEPAYTGMQIYSSAESGLEMLPEGTVTVLPNIAGHVGGDITAGAVAGRVMEQNGLTAYIDIGTNGEMILADGDEAYACSTAAGPAFEGASIECGMRAADGAIERVWIEDGEVYFRTIGQAPPQGICGSGLIDAIAQMLDAGLINKKGRLISADDAAVGGMPTGIAERLVEVDGKRKFLLTDNIAITQNDIREVQLAKGAVAAGLKLMLAKFDKTVDDLDRIMVAGAFGSYIDKESAVRIGLLPDVDLDKITSVGNAAGTGVSMALLSKKEMERTGQLPDRIQHLELAAEDNFQKVYMKSMGF